MKPPDCANCPLRDQHNQVYSAGADSPKFAIVGEAPGENEERLGRPFVGESGEVLDRVLARYDQRRSDALITNALLCRPLTPLSNAQWKQALVSCAPRLNSELSKTRYVLVTGAKALQSLTGVKGGIKKWSGGFIERNRHVFVPTFHPAFILRGAVGYTPHLWFHVGHFFRALRGERPKWPHVVLRPGRAALVVLKSLLRAPKTYWDIETLGIDPYTTKIMALGVGTDQVAVSLPFDDYDTQKYGHVRGLLQYPSGQEHLDLIKELWANKTPKGFQNGQHDIAGLSQEHRLGECGNYADDTLLAHGAMIPGVDHDLGAQYAQEFLAERYKQEFGAAADEKGADVFVKRRPRDLRSYNGKDVLATGKLDVVYHARRFDELPESRNTYAQYMALTKAAAMPMRARGINVDIPEMLRLREVLDAKRSAARREIQEFVGSADFNPGSPKQLGELFFTKLGVAPQRWTESGAPSTDEDALMDILRGTNEIAREVAQRIQVFRQYDKLIGTYIDGLEIVNGLVRPSWRVEGARTGRWSSQEPNMQNIPKGMRRMFIARPGMYFVEADFSQLELRIQAQLANAAKLLEWYSNSVDVHQVHADFLFDSNHPGQPATERERDLAKRFVYGLGYGGEDQTLWESLVVDFPNITIETIAKLRALFRELHPEIPLWQEALLKRVLELGYVEMPISKRRIRTWGRAKATEVMNYPIQGCLPHDTRILTPAGWQPIGDFTNGTVWTGANWAPAHRLNMGVAERCRVYLDSGQTFDCDDRHKFLVDDGAWPAWAHINDVVGKTVRVDQNTVWGKAHLTVEDWYWAGRLLGDGWVKDSGHWAIVFNHKEEDACRRFQAWLAAQLQGTSKTWPKSPGYTVDRGYSTTKVQCASLASQKIWARWGFFPGTRAKSKRIPGVVFTLDEARRKAFLFGWYDADGRKHPSRGGLFVDGKHLTRLTMRRLELAQDGVRLAQTLGLRSTVSKENTHPNNKAHWYDLSFIRQRPTQVLRVARLGRKEPMFTLSVDDPRHAYASEGLISKNSAADIINPPTLVIASGLDWVQNGLLLQVHDALYLEGPDPEVLAKTLRSNLQQHIVLNGIPMDYAVDVKVGRNWGPWHDRLRCKCDKQPCMKPDNLEGMKKYA